jgi:hypothetical protein
VLREIVSMRLKMHQILVYREAWDFNLGRAVRLSANLPHAGARAWSQRWGDFRPCGAMTRS